MPGPGMVAVRMRDDGGSDRAPGVYVEVSGLAVEAVFSKPDHEGINPKGTYRSAKGSMIAIGRFNGRLTITRGGNVGSVQKSRMSEMPSDDVDPFVFVIIRDLSAFAPSHRLKIEI